MSNRNPDEISGPRKPKGSLAMAINQGLGGPKLAASQQKFQVTNHKFQANSNLFGIWFL